jgi:RND superfamily putative drug exporter
VRTLALFSFRKRWYVLGAWIAALLVLGGTVGALGAGFSDKFSLPDTESARAFTLLEKVSKADSGDQITIVGRVTDGSMEDAGPKQRFSDALAKVAEDKAVVAKVASPYDNPGQVSTDDGGKIAFATVTLAGIVGDEVKADQVQDVVHTARDVAGDGLQIEVTGSAAQEQSAGGVAELLGLVGAAIILFLVFRAPLAMLLPLITAVVSIGVSLSFVGLVAYGITVATFTTSLVLLIGLGVGIDYALFIVTRYRQGRMDGLTAEEAVAEAVDTSGRAVLFAGMVVCIAILGLFALGISLFYGVAVSVTLAVLTTVFASLTLLPALIGFFGDRVLQKKYRGHTEGSAHETAAWQRWARGLQRRPALFAGLATAVMVLLLLPIFGIRLGLTDQGSDPKGSTTKKGYDLLAEGFGPGFNGPLLIVTKVGDDLSTEPTQKVVDRLKADPAVASVSGTAYLGGDDPAKPTAGGAAITTAYPKDAPQSKEVSDLVQHIRDDVVPGAVAGSGQEVYVGGATAVFEDFNDVIAGKLLLFVGVIVGVSFLLLTLVFRSLVVALVAAVMNILSAGAAFGIIVAVFQWGWGLELLGVSRTGPIISFLPVILFSVLFGLSMDYEVFLLSRVHEEWIKRKDNTEAVLHGLASTGRTITAAMSIMAVVFLAFVLEDNIIIKAFGLGLAIAVLLDALVVRSILVPSLMFLLGKSNWYLPKWLDKALPNVSIEGQSHEHVEPEPART